MLSVVVLISGAGSNLLALLEACENPLFPARIVAVGSDKAAAGLAHADLFGVPTFVVEPGKFSSREDWADKLSSNIDHFKPDLIVLAGFMKILPAGFVRSFSPRIINTHPSLLPDFKGAHAVKDALAAGVSQTGVTVHIVDEGVDTGPILAQRSVAVESSDTESTLHERIKVQERELLVATVQAIASGDIVLQEVVRG